MSVYINIPNVSVVIILIVFGMFVWQAYKVRLLYKLLEKATNSDDTLNALKETKIASIAESYAETICIDITERKQTNTPALEIFSEFSTCSAHKINLRLLDTAAGTLVGLGLLGTFLGLTLGIKDFDSSSTQNIQKSIQLLLSGMGTAFITSLVGMLLSMIYSLCDKYWRNRLSKHLHVLTKKLDSLYYIDDRTLDDLNEQALAKSIASTMKEVVEHEMRSVVNALNEKLTYNNESGEATTIANAIREILKENQEQSKALKSFSTDLAIELNNGFDEVLSRQMQQKILPLMENVDATTKAIVEHIDQMASQVSSPATDMIQTVVDELKNSMSEMMKEFSSGLSGSATNELETLAHQLGTAAQSMADFPNNMAHISSTLQVMIEEVKNTVSEISHTSANANSTAMQQMQEQITFATSAISAAIAEVKDVMSGISQSSQEQSNQMVSKLADAAEKMGTFLSGTISTLSLSVQQSVKSITDDVNNKQADLIALQEDTTSQTKKLLETFNTGLDRLEKMNEYITGTMNMFQQAQGQITGSTAHLQTITGDMKLATQLFNKSQTDYAVKMEEMQRNSQRGIDAVTELLKNSGDLSEDYVEKFETIRQGLGSIFQQLQSGLSEYSRTVQATTQKYLDQYSTSLTNTTDALSSTIQQQNEVVEMLVESLNAKKK
ncbi:MAG: MotA/TolQ/ExbB proton channel family protein [Prevotella sp.]|nr:MotA/TolQ/ExbB proton channel family protein [Prevotella sp.]